MQFEPEDRFYIPKSTQYIWQRRNSNSYIHTWYSISTGKNVFNKKGVMNSPKKKMLKSQWTQRLEKERWQKKSKNTQTHEQNLITRTWIWWEINNSRKKWINTRNQYIFLLWAKFAWLKPVRVSHIWRIFTADWL